MSGVGVPSNSPVELTGAPSPDNLPSDSNGGLFGRSGLPPSPAGPHGDGDIGALSTHFRGNQRKEK